MKNVFCVVAVMFLAACNGSQGAPGGNGDTGPQGPQGPVATTPVPTPVQQIVTNENAYRESLGQAPLSLGLSCQVQAIASGQYLSAASPGYTVAQAIVLSGANYPYLLTTGFNQANSVSGPNSVIDPAIQPLFLNNNYRIVCNGDVVVQSATDDYHSFCLSSDDGSILTVDGIVIISNDGSHAVSTVCGTKTLDPNVVHTFSLQYAQSGAGSFALTLNMDGALLPAANLYH